MKPINAINYTRILRCINKKTFEYFDVRIPSGQGEDFRQNILKNINSWSGGGVCGEGILGKAHYYALFNEGDEYGLTFAPFKKSKAPYIKDGRTGKIQLDWNGKKMKSPGIGLKVDLNTNKIIEDEIEERHLKILGVENIYDIFN